jgi:2,3-bisphosphoglycerate-independent phosphoglycerate mutase
VPFAIAGKRIESVMHGLFTERDAAAGDLHIDRGCELMAYFLTVR